MFLWELGVTLGADGGEIDSFLERVPAYMPRMSTRRVFLWKLGVTLGAGGCEIDSSLWPRWNPKLSVPSLAVG